MVYFQVGTRHLYPKWLTILRTWVAQFPLLASSFPAISPVPASAASHTSFPTISKIGVGSLRVEVGWPGPLCLMEDKEFETQP